MKVELLTSDGIQQVITSQVILQETPAWMTSSFFQLQEDDIMVSKKHEKILLQILFLLHKLSKEGFVFQTNYIWIKSSNELIWALDPREKDQ